jgi:hypothetical protein
MKYLLLFFVFILLLGCSPLLNQSYKKLSRPEKNWVVFHALKAKKAFYISKEAEKITDSIGLTGQVENDKNGGQLDAFKHSYWMARLTQGIGKRASLSLGKAHEKGNFIFFKKGKSEDGAYPDKKSSEMDLFNNVVGVEIGRQHKNEPKKRLIQIVLDSLVSGNMKILKKDKWGNFLDCQSHKIPLDSLRIEWETKKCLVPSNS